MKNYIHFIILWVFLIAVGSVVVFEVYSLPDHQVQIKGNGNDLAEFQLSVMANQISSMNYLLTFIGIAGAVAGVAFTIFGYYQSTKFPEMVKKEVSNQIKLFEETEKENNKKIYRRINDALIEKEIKIYESIFEKQYDELYKDLILNDNDFDYKDKFLAINQQTHGLIGEYEYKRNNSALEAALNKNMEYTDKILKVAENELSKEYSNDPRKYNDNLKSIEYIAIDYLSQTKQLVKKEQN